MTNTTENSNVVTTGSMPIPMAVNSKINPQPATGEIATEAAKTETNKAVSKPEQKKDLAHFKCEVGRATLVFWRSTKFLADVLIDARCSLSKEDFLQLIAEAKLDYTYVCKLVKQGADFRLNDPENEGIMPEAFSTRHEIMLMKESTFRLGVAKKIIHADCKLADLRKFRDQIEGKSDKPKKSAKAKPSAASPTAEPPQPTSAKLSVQPGEEAQLSVVKAAVKAPVNTSALRPSEKGSADSATATAPATGRITILMPKEVAGQHKADLDRLKNDIETLVKEYSFISAVDLEVAA